jgi:teichuronic acid biosynthesis glycosyltransferase TuaG
LHPLVSVIMPVFNASDCIEESIQSVLNQTYPNFELILVNDGSTDNSEQLIKNFSDTRIKYFRQANGGVSKARNLGLANMKGEYFCFLDADDYFPPKSLESRISLFAAENTLNFVDGIVLRKDKNLKNTLSVYTPAFKGNPQPQLLRLSEKCFLGYSCMVKRDPKRVYAFNEELTHLEDFLFFFEISKEGKYSFTTEEILWYRQGNATAMTNLEGLAHGYYYVYNFIKKNNLANYRQRLYLKFRIVRILFLSHLFVGRNIRGAVQSLINFFR